MNRVGTTVNEVNQGTNRVNGPHVMCVVVSSPLHKYKDTDIYTYRKYIQPDKCSGTKSKIYFRVCLYTQNIHIYFCVNQLELI